MRTKLTEQINDNYKKWYSEEARAEHSGERYTQISNDMLIADLDDMAQIFSGLNFAEWNVNTEAKRHWSKMLEVVKNRLNQNYNCLTRYVKDNEVYFNGNGRWLPNEVTTWKAYKEKFLSYVTNNNYNLILFNRNTLEIVTKEDWEYYNDCEITEALKDDKHRNVIVNIKVD